MEADGSVLRSRSLQQRAHSRSQCRQRRGVDHQISSIRACGSNQSAERLAKFTQARVRPLALPGVQRSENRHDRERVAGVDGRAPIHGRSVPDRADGVLELAVGRIGGIAERQVAHPEGPVGTLPGAPG